MISLSLRSKIIIPFVTIVLFITSITIIFFSYNKIYIQTILIILFMDSK
jgi:hypothetical protein